MTDNMITYYRQGKKPLQEIRIKEYTIQICSFEETEILTLLKRYQEVKIRYEKRRSKMVLRFLLRVYLNYRQRAYSKALSEWAKRQNGILVLSNPLKQALCQTRQQYDLFSKLPAKIHAMYGICLLEQMNLSCVLIVLPKNEMSELEENLYHIMQSLQKRQEQIRDLIFFSATVEQTRYMDAFLDEYIEETGIAATCYERGEKELEQTNWSAYERGVILDFKGMQVERLELHFNMVESKLTYIDACGNLNAKEIRYLTGHRIVVKSLANSLDRGFACGL